MEHPLPPAIAFTQVALLLVLPGAVAIAATVAVVVAVAIIVAVVAFLPFAVAASCCCLPARLTVLNHYS